MPSIRHQISLPFPPSVNSIWRGGRGRVYKSKKYVDWIKLADQDFLAQKDGPIRTIKGPFHAYIWAYRPDKRLRDLDNIIKPLLDYAKRVELIKDDSNCDFLQVAWVTEAPVDLNFPTDCMLVLEGD